MRQRAGVFVKERFREEDDVVLVGSAIEDRWRVCGL
jgi:hypothetical protein